jgi:hypothetical protein
MTVKSKYSPKAHPKKKQLSTYTLANHEGGVAPRSNHKSQGTSLNGKGENVLVHSPQEHRKSRQHKELPLKVHYAIQVASLLSTNEYPHHRLDVTIPLKPSNSFAYKNHPMSTPCRQSCLVFLGWSFSCCFSSGRVS